MICSFLLLVLANNGLRYGYRFFDVVSNDEFCVLHLFAFLCLFFRNFVLTGKREELRLLLNLCRLWHTCPKSCTFFNETITPQPP